MLVERPCTKPIQSIDAFEEHLRIEKQRVVERCEVDRLAEYAAKNAEARLDTSEQHQLHLERRLSELAIAMNGICQEQRIQEQRFTGLEAAVADTVAQVREISCQGLCEEQRCKEQQSQEQRFTALEASVAATAAQVRATSSQGLCKEQRIQEQRVTALETTLAATIAQVREGSGEGWLEKERAISVEFTERLAALEDLAAASVEHKVAPLHHRLQVLEARASSPWDELPTGGCEADVSSALLVVQELEGLMQLELKSVHNHCNMLQDVMDERVVVPLRRTEQRLDEHDQKVAQCFVAVRDCSCRIEEHEFRLGVTRTKIEVHDQKIASLDKPFRWHHRNDEDVDSSIHPSPSETFNRIQRDLQSG